MLRWCVNWLEELETQEFVSVNLLPPTDEQSKEVPFDRPRVFRVLSRAVSDLERLALAEESKLSDRQDVDPRQKHRERLAEPEPQPRELTQKEKRAILRKSLGLPPGYTRSDLIGS